LLIASADLQKCFDSAMSKFDRCSPDRITVASLSCRYVLLPASKQAVSDLAVTRARGGCGGCCGGGGTAQLLANGVACMRRSIGCCMGKYVTLARSHCTNGKYMPRAVYVAKCRIAIWFVGEFIRSELFVCLSVRPSVLSPAIRRMERSMPG
jgi:hypothetical protein